MEGTVWCRTVKNRLGSLVGRFGGPCLGQIDVVYGKLRSY